MFFLSILQWHWKLVPVFVNNTETFSTYFRSPLIFFIVFTEQVYILSVFQRMLGVFSKTAEFFFGVFAEYAEKHQLSLPNTQTFFNCFRQIRWNIFSLFCEYAEKCSPFSQNTPKNVCRFHRISKKTFTVFAEYDGNKKNTWKKIKLLNISKNCAGTATKNLVRWGYMLT